MLFSKAYIDYNSVIYHVHVPKSGGSSVRECLAKYFKDYQFLRLNEPSINHYYSNQINSFVDYKNKNIIKKWLKQISITRKFIDLAKFIKDFYNKNQNLIFRDFHLLSTREKIDLRFISSFQERMFVPDILGKNYLKIMTIRDPVSRIQSYYFQAKKRNKKKHNDFKSQNISKPYMIAADRYDIDDFIKYLYDESPYMVSNPNCICISGTQDYLISKKIIDNDFFLAAPIEKLDKFLELITFKVFKEKKNKKFHRYNVGENNPKKILISDKLIERIKLSNTADIDLKNHIELEFDKILNNQEL